MSRGLPPYAKLLGIQPAPAEHEADLMLPFGLEVLGRPGFMHGGAIAGLLEIGAVAAIDKAIAGMSPMPRTKQINMTVDFMRGGREATTYALGTVGRLGKRVANVDVIAWQDDRKRLIARAHINFLLVPLAAEKL